MKKYFRATTAFVSAAALLQPCLTPCAYAQSAPAASVAQYKQYQSSREVIRLLRQKVKYVFVIFHENESFDHYFGTFPGANGLFSAPTGAKAANATSSFVQKYLDTSLNTATASPFLMPQAVQTAAGAIVPIYPADLISVDHSHQGMANSMHVKSSRRRGE